MEEMQQFFKPELVWFIVGFIMLVVEFVAPGVFFIFFAFGAWIVAVVCLAFTIPLVAQLLIFLISSVLFIILLRKRLQKIFIGTSSKAEEDFPDEFIGKKAVVKSRITRDRPGKIEFRGSLWTAEADEPIDEDMYVIIEGRESLTMKVKKIEI